MIPPVTHPPGRGILAAIGLLASLITSLASPLVSDLKAQALTFVQQPTSTQAGQEIDPPVRVRAPNIGVGGVTITLSLASGPDEGELEGDTTKDTSPISDTATFDDLTIERAGTYTLRASATGYTDAISNAFQITPGPPDPDESEITASPTSIPADGSSTSMITVTVRDEFENPVSGATVVLATTLGTLDPATATDNGDGTYTSTLTAGTAPGTATVSGTVDGEEIDDEATVQFTPLQASGATSEITADPTSIPADGSSTSTITVQLKDAFGNDLTAGGDNVALSTTAGSLSAVNDNGDGTYTATLTSSTTPTTAEVSGTVNGESITDNATVEFTQVGSPTLVVQVQPSDTPVNAVITPAVVVRVTDGLGNTLTDFSGNVTVGLATNPTGATLSGTLVRPAQNGVVQFDDLRIDRPGTGYRLGFSSPQVTGATSEFFAITSGAASPARSLITADPTSIPANGTSTSAITVQLRDANGNPLSSGGDDVRLTTTLGTLGAVSDRGNGIYTATLTSSTTPGTATIRGTVNGAQITDTATVTFAAGTADLEVEVSVSDDTPAVGDNVVYVVTVRNGGPEAATGVRLNQDLHPRLAFLSATTSQGSYEAATGTWSVGTLVVGQRATLTLVVSVRGAGEN